MTALATFIGIVLIIVWLAMRHLDGALEAPVGEPA
jgi:hypothetical protein